MDEETTNKRIVRQAWAFFHHWYHDPDSVQAASFRDSLFNLLKESDPNWYEKLNPPTLGVQVADHVRAGESLGPSK